MFFDLIKDPRQFTIYQLIVQGTTNNVLLSVMIVGAASRFINTPVDAKQLSRRHKLEQTSHWS